MKISVKILHFDRNIFIIVFHGKLNRGLFGDNPRLSIGVGFTMG